MIKFFIFLISISVCYQQSQAQNNISGIEKLVQANVDIESLGLDNIEKPTPEPKKDIPKSNLIDTITKVEEKNTQDLKMSIEVTTKTKENISFSSPLNEGMQTLLESWRQFTLEN